jgi:hypothetical protein
MMGREASLVDRLCEAENPWDLDDWKDRDGYYVAACRVSADDVPGLIDIVRRWGDVDLPGDRVEPQIDKADAELLPITAWRTLADLKAGAAVEPLVNLLTHLGDESDDWVFEELPHVFGKIGEPAIGPLTRLAADDSKPDSIRSIAARGLHRVAHYHADTRDRIVACLTEMMANAVDGHLHFNTTLLTELVDLRAVEAAEPIERAFAGNLLDVGMMGNWEEVRRRLGVEGLGLTMPENPHNSLEDFRRQLGIGSFSDRPLFTRGEIDHKAAEAYYERACEAFSKSSEAQQVIERYGELGWIRSVLEFGITYLGQTVDEMTPVSVSEFVLDFVPRKVSTEADSATWIIDELILFWGYLDRVYKLSAAKSIVEWLKTDGLVARLEAALSDPSNFGMAKSMFMLGKKSGYDMTSEAGIAQFMMDYNRSLLSDKARAAASPVARKHRVGRNELCPCGSGKKFKKCCGRPS